MICLILAYIEQLSLEVLMYSKFMEKDMPQVFEKGKKDRNSLLHHEKILKRNKKK